MTTFKKGDTGVTQGGWPYRVTSTGPGGRPVVTHFTPVRTIPRMIHEKDGSIFGADEGHSLLAPTGNALNEYLPLSAGNGSMVRNEPALGRYAQVGDIALQSGGVTVLDFFAVHCDLDMHRGAQGGIGTITAKLVMNENPPADRGTIESLKWWAEAESRYRFLKAQAMVKAREWIA